MSLRIAPPLLLLAVFPGMLRAQAPEPTRLTLEQVVAAAMERNPELAMAQQRLAIGAGQLLTARGAFSTRLSTAVTQTRATERSMGTDGVLSTQPTVLNGSYQVGLARQFRSGVLVQPAVTMARTDVAADGALTANRGSVGMQVMIPLWKDRGGAVQRMPEQAAAHEHEAARLSLGHTASAAVQEAASAYWGLVAARQRAEVFRGSEQRAQRMADETRVLVAAGERPAADLNQLLANVATKRIARIAAEQGVREAQRRLGLVLGMEPARVWSLAPDAADFPAADAVALDSATLQRLVALAVERRPDLAAVRGGGRAAETLMNAARADLKPRLDLSVSLGYDGLEMGSGMSDRMAPLYRNLPGLNSSVQLQYQLPVRNSEAQGRMMQRAAVLQQQRIQEHDLLRQIATGVAVALEALQGSAESAAQAEAAVGMYRAAVDNERKKHQLDAATLLDVIMAEDALTNAMLGQVSARLGYVLAALTLRYETGSLVRMEEGGPVARAEDLSTLPAAR